MSLVVNHNLMASNVARNLNSHYNRLATSTQRLSSGLRVNSAADDAAGLAIRELQRADIAALHQGARNANDAISMIQTADGAMSVIDEKLIRLKELAEQAATGTYDSTQRLMIESEYQAMCDEITRIANATDFNGIKLLDGTLSGAKHDGSNLVSTGKLKVHFGAGNDSAEDYYYISIGDVRAHALGLGHESTWDNASGKIKSMFSDKLDEAMAAVADMPDADVDKVNKLTENWKAEFNAQIDVITSLSAENHPALKDLWLQVNAPDALFLDEGKEDSYTLPYSDGKTFPDAADFEKMSEREKEKWRYALGRAALYNYANGLPQQADPADPASPLFSAQTHYRLGKGLAPEGAQPELIDDTVEVAVSTHIPGQAAQGFIVNIAHYADYDKTEFMNSGYYNTTLKDKIQKIFDDNNLDVLATERELAARAPEVLPADPVWNKPQIDTTKYVTGDMNFEEDFTKIDDIPNKENFAGTALGSPDVLTAARMALDGALKGTWEYGQRFDYAGQTIQTQEDAQIALRAINDAIVEKDKIRANLGAIQNRLENTITNLNTQAENLQAAESRISDVDVATEMTDFVRNQILTQAAVAMLSQANSLPQMAMQLIGG